MEPYYMGIDVSKGYADFMIINSKKHPVVQGFQLDDTFDGHRSLYNIRARFLSNIQIQPYLLEWKVPVDMKTTGTMH